MQKIKELIREVYHYEKKSEIETRYLSNVLLWFCLMVFLINLFNNSMKKNPGIYIFCLVVCVIGVWDAFHIRNAKNVELPDEVIQKPSLTEEQYKIYQTYVSRGYKIIRELQIADDSVRKREIKNTSGKTAGGGNFRKNKLYTIIYLPFWKRLDKIGVTITK